VSETFTACLSGATLRQACAGLTDDLLKCGIELPSVYLLIGDRLRCFAARGYFQVVDGFPQTAGVIGSVVATGIAVCIPDVRERQDFIAAVPGLLGEACVPIVVCGQVVGAVNAESVGLLPPDCLPVLEAAAVALATRIAQLGGMPQESLMQRVARAAVELSALDDAATLEGRAVRLACELSRMSSAVLVRRSLTGLAVTTAVGPLAEDLSALSGAELTTMAKWVSAGTSSHFPGHRVPPSYDFLHRAGLRCLAVYPLIAAGHQTGLLLTADTAIQAHRTNVVGALELLAAQVATGLSALEAFQQMRRRAITDPLTGVGNFGAFVADLTAAAPDGASEELVTCVLLDVDHFKAINDTHGHLAGDQLLQKVVDALCRSVRASDNVYRLGGDEFAVLARGGDHDDARQLAERVLTAVRTTSATASVGYASQTGALSELRARADTALYAAKRAGRDTLRGSDKASPAITQ